MEEKHPRSALSSSRMRGPNLTSNLKFWKKNSRIYTLANECDGDRFDPRIREDDKRGASKRVGIILMDGSPHSRG